MAENSNIEWTDHTANLWWGCAKVHTGCKNCYAEFLSETRYGNGVWGEKAPRKRIKSTFRDLAKYQRGAKFAGERHRVFVGSMMDIFEEGKELMNPTGEATSTADLREQLFAFITSLYYPDLIFLFLTKRPQNIPEMVPDSWLERPPHNVWFGTSISDEETQEYSSRLYTATKDMEGAKRFLSIEPQVGLIGHSIPLNGIHWIIQGGESGAGRRPFELSWASTMRAVAKSAGVPYFFKQIDKKQEIPPEYLIRELPEF